MAAFPFCVCQKLHQWTRSDVIERDSRACICDGGAVSCRRIGRQVWNVQSREVFLSEGGAHREPVPAIITLSPDPTQWGPRSEHSDWKKEGGRRVKPPRQTRPPRCGLDLFTLCWWGRRSPSGGFTPTRFYQISPARVVGNVIQESRGK